ncbi:hypothetical protein Sru01_30640 [Sphaerisporangium rufum]|uniref:Peptidase inhibitor family I36 n=1 Tax=Sphaerisporangium rufum TaxID=1381558 RepID=A0A919R6K2_9ACTN|nr:peptidase inhibitor family I36 protein [Sphaerisporangium rufum]GII78082.1 hypothetical protein Sru01_30640 [Sphaerisporangium rufum]
MNRGGKAMTALGIAVLALLAVPGAAQADDAPAAENVSAAAADGNLYAWDGINRTGAWCRWAGNDSNWDNCSGNTSWMRNRASSLENRGYAGAYEDVDLYYNTNYGGSHICLWNGRYLNNLSGIYYSWDGLAGQGQTTNNNIASHRWSNNC